MKRIIFINLLLLIAAAGCASMQTEIIAEPGWIDSITVGHFTTANPVDDELIGAYLRKELAKRGFKVVDDSPHVLTGAIDVDLLYSSIVEARIVLKKDSDQVVWFYRNESMFLMYRKEFARYLAERIAKQLR